MDPTYRALIMQRRKKSNRKGFLPALLAGLAGANIISQIGNGIFNRKSGTRKGRYMGRTSVIPKGLLGGVRKSSVNRRKGFDNRKGKMSKLILKKVMGVHKRKGKFSRRKGDLDADFLNEFGGDKLNVEPSYLKSGSRLLFDTFKKFFKNKKNQKTVTDGLAKGSKSIIDRYIGNLTKKDADKAATSIIAGKKLPQGMVKDLEVVFKNDPNTISALGKFR